MTTINPTGSGPFFCRPCNRRFDIGGRCNCCGSMRTAWYAPKRRWPPVACPACRSALSKLIDDATQARQCIQCHAEFEPVEVSYADTRGLENAIKREELEQRAAAHPHNNRLKHRVGRREQK